MDAITDVAKANDKFRTQLRSTWIASPADATLLVNAIPTNLPTIMVVGWETDLETVFLVTGASGTSSANYALTGVTRLKGANENLPEQTTVNCLNNEEFFNQYETKMNEIIAALNDALADFPVGTVVGTTDTQTLTNKRITSRTGTTTSSATPTINTNNVDFYSITAQTEAITSFTTNLSGTPTERQTLWIAITGTAARAITWGASFEASTVALPTTTVTTTRLDVGFVWNTVTSKWRCMAQG